MKININNANFSSIVECSNEELNLLRELLSYKTLTYQRGKWFTIPIYLINKKTKIFPTGLLSLIKENFENVIIEGEPTLPQFSLTNESLDQYQYEILNKALSLKRSIINIPTGAGKTYSYCSLATNLSLKTFILTPTQEILNQVIDHLKVRGADFGVIWNTKENTDNKIIVSTCQTLYSRLQYLKEEIEKVEMLICDEAHFYGSNIFFKIGMSFPNAWYRFGFSGTPFGRSDKADLKTKAVFSPHTITYEGKIERIVPITVLFVQYSPDLFASYTDYTALLNDNSRINTICKCVEYLKKESYTPYLIFTDRIEYGQKISNILNIPFVSSTYNERSEIFDKIRKNEIEGLITTVGWIGLDIPNLRAIVNTSRETTKISLGQKAGRVRRKTEDKSLGVVIDLYDNCGKHPKKWTKRRLNTYKQLNFDVKIVTI